MGPGHRVCGRGPARDGPARRGPAMRRCRGAGRGVRRSRVRGGPPHARRHHRRGPAPDRARCGPDRPRLVRTTRPPTGPHRGPGRRAPHDRCRVGGRDHHLRTRRRRGPPHRTPDRAGVGRGDPRTGHALGPLVPRSDHPVRDCRRPDAAPTHRPRTRRDRRPHHPQPVLLPIRRQRPALRGPAPPRRRNRHRRDRRLGRETTHHRRPHTHRGTPRRRPGRTGQHRRQHRGTAHPRRTPRRTHRPSSTPRPETPSGPPTTDTTSPPPNNASPPATPPSPRCSWAGPRTPTALRRGAAREPPLAQPRGTTTVAPRHPLPPCASPPSPSGCSVGRSSPWPSDGAVAPRQPPNAAPSQPATAAASSPAARYQPKPAKPTTSPNGPQAAVPTCPTSCSCVGATIARSTCTCGQSHQPFPNARHHTHHPQHHPAPPGQPTTTPPSPSPAHPAPAGASEGHGP